MSDTNDATSTPETTAETHSEAPETPQDAFDGPFDAERAARKIANIRADLDKARAERDDYKTRWTEYEDSQKSEAQKLAEAAEAARADAVKAQGELLRYKIAATKGLDPELLPFLPAGSEDEVSAAADVLVAKLAAASAPRRPQPDPTQASTANGKPPATLDEQIASAERDGDFSRSIALKAQKLLGQQ